MQNSPTPNQPVIDVAAGILTQADGQVLMAKRPTGKPWAGYWEFPGGKIEAGEQANEALARELHEEIGIQVIHAFPWITRQYPYPERTVRLHLYRVFKWHGKPHSKEGQQLNWENPYAIQCAPLLPANHQLLKDLCLPPIYAITQASKYSADNFIQRVKNALDNGIRLIQIREQMDQEQLARLTNDIISIAHNYDARVLINGDTALAQRTGADGVHFQTSQLMQCQQRPAVALWGASCHNREELLKAATLGVDFVVLSPVLPTQSHPDAPTLGWKSFTELCLDMPMPVYALGGMQTDTIETAMTHSAHGVAMLSGVW